MNKILSTLMAFLMIGTAAQAQCLTLKKKYPENRWQGETLSYVNKPNGPIYRLREEVQCTDLPLIRRVDDDGDNQKRLIISEQVGGDKYGWLALYRNQMLAPTFDFVVVLYDKDKVADRAIDLCQISNTYNCEVQDVRYDPTTDRLFFNMACPSYSSQIDGKGSKLFCYDVENEKMIWSTPYLTSNDILIFNDKYVFCSYGFTREKDYIFMLDKFTGKIYSKLPVATSIQYMEIKQKGGHDLLYASDYNESLYIYDINDVTVAQPAKPAAKKTVAKKRSK